MNKKILLLLLLFVSLKVNADSEVFSSTQRGIQIVPLSNQNIPENMKIDIIKNKNEQEIKGYITKNDNEAGLLLNFKKNAERELRSSEGKKYGDQDTHLKRSLSEVKLSFPFIPIKGVPQNNVIGYAVGGSFDKDKGWDGIKEYFIIDEIGNCAYSKMRILAAQLVKEVIDYSINGKPSDNTIAGNVNEGFVYTINWFTDTHINILECANKNFDKNIMNKMIVYANIIDKN